MAGKSTINNSGRTVIPSDKTIKIVKNFEDALGSKRQLQLRNRCISLKNIQVIKRRKSHCHRLKNISPSFSESLKSVRTNACANISVSPDTLETTRFSSMISLANYQEDDLDYEPEFENRPHSGFAIRDESPNVTQNIEHIRNEFNNDTDTLYDSATEDNFSVSHRSDMLPFTRNHNGDNEVRNDYIMYTPANSSQVLLDSSSSNGSSHKGDNIEDDENSYSTDYDISEELENRLLESDENVELSLIENENSESLSDEEQDQIQEAEDLDFQKEYSAFQDSQVKKIGNNFVITAFNKDTNQKVCIKEPNNAKPQLTVKRRNRNNWNVHYHPYESVTLFLNDIGYIAPPLSSKISESSSEGSGSDSAALTNFKVTFGALYKRRCEKVQPIESAFKVPLPPIKRPPTRPKRPGSSSPSSNMSPSSSVTDSLETYNREKFISDNRAIKQSPLKEDDAISIVASSIDRFEMEEVQSSLDHDGFDADDIKNRSYVEDWVSSHVGINAISTPSNSVCSVQSREHSTKIILGPRLNFKDVNPFFSGLCFRYYFNESCSRKSCRIPHTVNIMTFTRKCWELQKSELESIYNFTLRFHLLFSHIYPVLLNGFAYHRMENKLITCIDDFFELKSVVDSRSAVEKIIAALVQTGLTFSEAIEKISFNVGFLRHPELADILLDLITQKPNLSENWEEIKRICRAKNYMPPNILERIISRILVTPTNTNKDICRDIYNVVVKNELTDLSKVNAELLNPLKTLAQFGSNVNNDNNNSLSNVIDKNLLIERQRFEQEEAQSEPRSHVITADSDERKFQYTSTRVASLQFSPRATSSKSSTSSEKFTSEIDNQLDFVAPASENNYHYVPQAVGVVHQTTEKPAEPKFIINISPPTFSRQPITLNRTPSTLNRTPEPLNRTPQPLSRSPQPLSRSPQPLNRIPQTLNMTPQPFNKPPSSLNRPPPLMALKIPEPIIKSPKSPPLEVNLCPEIPIFGKFRYKKGFVFDECLHNLLPSSRDQVPMNEDDIIKLNDIIRTGNGSGFLQILEQYKGPNTLQNFITMSLAHLKNCNNRPYNTLTDLIENIDIIKPEFKRDPFLKGVFEVIVFNLLFFLERRCQWTDGRKLIESFCDWDSLISSKQLSMRKLTPMGRYIFLAKFLTEAKAFYKVYDILHSTELNLLECPEKWSLFHSPTADLENRNVLLTEFFKYAYMNNIEVVCDIYRNIFQFGDIWEFDALSYFNPMLENLINTEKTSSLKHFFSDIEIFYKKMNRNVLRAFIIYLDPHLSNENKLKLYLIGAKKGIYVDYTGNETTILVRTNMPDAELTLIIAYYIHKFKLLPIELSNHDLKIEIKLPSEVFESPNILQRCCRSVAEINSSVKSILYHSFGIFFKQPDQNYSGNSTVVEITKTELNEFRNASR